MSARRAGIPFVIAAPSGTGKTTVCRRLVAADPQLELSVSHTTRTVRPGERDGEHYHFVSPAQFQALVELSRAAPELAPNEVTDRLDAIAALSADLTTATQQRPRQTATDPDADAVRVVRDLLRAVASGRELEQAAGLLASAAPGLADVLRIYGTGTDAAMREHLASVRHLMG